MGKEKALLSFIAVLVGLLCAGIAFYFYENSKTIPPSKIKTIAVAHPSPTPKPSVFLSLDKPKDEEVVEKKIISILGKTTSSSTVIILTSNEEQILTPTSNGDFSTTINIENGQNLIEITAIAQSGESARITRTVTFSTEEF